MVEMAGMSLFQPPLAFLHMRISERVHDCLFGAAVLLALHYLVLLATPSVAALLLPLLSCWCWCWTR